MNEDNNIIQQEVSNASRNLAQAFQKLMENCIASYSQDLQAVPEQIVRLSNQISQVERKQQQSLNSFDSIRQLFENTVSANNLLEKAGQVNLLLGKQHYDKHITEPMLRSLLPVVDIIVDSRKHNKNCSCNSANVINSIYSQLLQFLSSYGVEIFTHSERDKFDPQSMKPIKWEYTAESSLDNSVARSLQAGFRLNQTRILRMETVSLFKYKPSETNNVNLIERTENHDTKY